MILPRFSTRAILVVMAVCAVYFLMVGLAIRGSTWAAGVAIGATSLVLAACVHAGLFGLCYVLSTRSRRRINNPYVAGTTQGDGP